MRKLSGLIETQVELMRPPDLVELRKKAESDAWVPYNTKSFALDTARTNELVGIEGDFVQAWTNGNYEGIGIRFNSLNNDLVYFQRSNPIYGFRFWKLFLTHTAQSGKTLDLLIGRQSSAFAKPTEFGSKITKTIQTELKAITAVAADVQSISSELALANVKKVTIFIDHAKDNALASAGQGTEYVIQVSEKASGNDTWRSLASFTAAITAPSTITLDAEEAAGQTLIEIGVTTPVVGDIVFFKNAIIANSEWGNVIAISAGVSFTLESGLTITQGSAGGTIFTQGEHFVLTIDVEAVTRLRVVCNNTKGSTNRAVVYRVAAITVV